VSNRTILLVEDNPDDEALTLRAIRKNSISEHVIVVHDGVEALDYLFSTGKYIGRDISDLPNVVLLDLKLPRLDGLETLRRLRADDRTKLLPIVVFTTSNEEQDILKSYRLGANSYIRKPIDYDEFNNAIRQIGKYWLFLNEGASVRKGT